jgi:hypothetical protein
MNFDEVTLELDAERYEPFKDGVPGRLRVVLPLAVNLLGSELPSGHLVGELPPSDVPSRASERLGRQRLRSCPGRRAGAQREPAVPR